MKIQRFTIKYGSKELEVLLIVVLEVLEEELTLEVLVIVELLKDEIILEKKENYQEDYFLNVVSCHQKSAKLNVISFALLIIVAIL